jgi:hypothetical protein
MRGDSSRRSPISRLLGSEGAYDEDSTAGASLDEELRRVSRPVTSVAGRPGFSTAYIPGPVDWGLESYADDDEEDEVRMVAPEGVVSSNWRFWAIMLAIFSAVLFGIMVAGFFFLRDLRTESDQLAVENQQAAIPITFETLHEDPDSLLDLRGEGYVEKGRGRALLTLRGLPIIGRTDRYVIWADNGAGTLTRVAERTVGSSVQYVEVPQLPPDAKRLFLTIEASPPEGERPLETPLGEVLMQADIP